MVSHVTKLLLCGHYPYKLYELHDSNVETNSELFICPVISKYITNALHHTCVCVCICMAVLS